MKPILTKECAFSNIQDFLTSKPFVLFGTGTSFSVDPQFGMPALQTFLTQNINVETRSTEAAEWESVLNLLSQGSDLESALNEISSSKLRKRKRQIMDTFF